ncbi:hypothetical protein EV182_003980 [Spiromyces aspiralis]|uniref:Uncharacterized protein n=1 Tax=Spiromyces aspiralis TaxID=68401 RepID=A0ACC1HPU5_9FUNG|nr:hypothetical protein EV182_003980 [Spiromyces aspiralis]
MSFTTRLATVRRAYTSTSDYSRVDQLNKSEYEKTLHDDNAYLRQILEEDDAQAPWNQQPVRIYNRSVQNIEPMGYVDAKQQSHY